MPEATMTTTTRLEVVAGDSPLDRVLARRGLSKAAAARLTSGTSLRSIIRVCNEGHVASPKLIRAMRSGLVEAGLDPLTRGEVRSLLETDQDLAVLLSLLENEGSA